MYTIKGFTTKKNILEQLVKAGVSIKLPFKAVIGGKNVLDVEKNPLAGFDTKTFDDEEQTIKEI